MPIAVRPYQPGDAGQLLTLHATYYPKHWGFPGRRFEALLARDMADLLARLDDPRNGIWSAERDGAYGGGIAIDGSGTPPDAQLRWFILGDAVRGQGAGRVMLDTALDHCRQHGLASVYLHTFAGLDAARRLYEAAGFVLTEERDNDSWGIKLKEQRFCLDLTS